jgi:hypothetical protein
MNLKKYRVVIAFSIIFFSANVLKGNPAETKLRGMLQTNPSSKTVQELDQWLTEINDTYNQIPSYLKVRIQSLYNNKKHQAELLLRQMTSISPSLEIVPRPEETYPSLPFRQQPTTADETILKQSLVNLLNATTKKVTYVTNTGTVTMPLFEMTTTKSIKQWNADWLNFMTVQLQELTRQANTQFTILARAIPAYATIPASTVPLVTGYPLYAVRALLGADDNHILNTSTPLFTFIEGLASQRVGQNPELVTSAAQFAQALLDYLDTIDQIIALFRGNTSRYQPSDAPRLALRLAIINQPIKDRYQALVQLLETVRGLAG